MILHSQLVSFLGLTVIMVFFGLGRLFYVILLLINAVAVLSEERFLVRSK